MLRVSRRQRRQWRSGPARVIAFDELWTYVGARRRGQRRSRWVWTAVVEGRMAVGGLILRWVVGMRAPFCVCMVDCRRRGIVNLPGFTGYAKSH